MSRRRMTKKKGGKLIGKGMYGCVYEPALRCKDSTVRTPDAISKWMRASHAIEEYASHNLLAPINATQQYFLYPISICEPDANVDPAVNNLNACNIGVPRHMPYTKSVEYLYGGENLEELTLHPSEYLSFFKGLANLFEGLELLHANDYVHLDIKLLNTVALKKSDNSFHVRFIDFGFLTKCTNKNKIAFFPLGESYFAWSYETRFASFFDGRNERGGPVKKLFDVEQITEDSLKDFFEKAINNHNLRPYLPEFYLERIYSKKTEGYKTLLEDLNRDLTEENKLRIVLKGTDVYSLGVLLLVLYQKLTKHHAIDNPRSAIGVQASASQKPGISMDDNAVEWNKEVIEKISTSIFELALEMMDTNVRTRLNASDAAARYQSILIEMERLFTSEKVERGLAFVGVTFAPRPKAPFVPKAKATVVAPPELGPNNVLVPPPNQKQPLAAPLSLNGLLSWNGLQLQPLVSNNSPLQELGRDANNAGERSNSSHQPPMTPNYAANALQAAVKKGGKRRTRKRTFSRK